MDSQSRHILVVDDVSEVGEVIADSLRHRGHRVTIANGGKAMRSVLQNGHGIALVVLDSNMPGEPSASLAAHAKELRLPVVMMSGSPDSMEFAAEHGMQLLHKPFRIDALTEAVDKALDSGEFGQRSD